MRDNGSQQDVIFVTGMCAVLKFTE